MTHHEWLTPKRSFICWSDTQHRPAPSSPGPISTLPSVFSSFRLSFLLVRKINFSWWMNVLTSDRLGWECCSFEDVFGVSASVDSPEWKCLLGHSMRLSLCVYVSYGLGGMMLYIVKWFKCVNTPVCLLFMRQFIQRCGFKIQHQIISCFTVTLNMSCIFSFAVFCF